MKTPENARIGLNPLSAERPTGYLPTLDGWRAVAILAVIFHHESLHSIGPVSTSWLYEYGRNGVDLFFAISGLLICWRLLEEEHAFGCISLRNFYTRRAFRILPPAIVFLFTLGILSLAGVLKIGWRELLGCILFFRNYTALLGHLGPDLYFTAHFWSLAVEEHFYLILPALLVLTRKRWRLPVLLSLVLIVEIHRMHVLGTRDWEEVFFHTGMRLNQLLIPAVLAVLVQSRKVREKIASWLRIWPLLLIAVLYLLSSWEGHFWQTTLASLLMPMILLGTILNPRGFLAVGLEWAPLKYLGRISYSLYLWQELFITGHLYKGDPLGILQRTPLRFVALLTIAIASYHLLERPLIRLGHKLAPPATPGRSDIEGGAPMLETSGQMPSPQLESRMQ